MTTWHVAANSELPGGWRLLRIDLAEAASRVIPGHWLELDIGSEIVAAPVMDASIREGWAACLLRAEPEAPAARLRRGEALTACLRGTPAEPPASDPPSVIIGEGNGIGPALFLASRGRPDDLRPVVFLGTANAFPFQHRPSQFVVPGLPPHTIATAPVLEGQGLPGRLAHPTGLPGCFEGTAAELFHYWCDTTKQRPERVYGFGPASLGEGLTRHAVKPAFSEIP